MGLSGVRLHSGSNLDCHPDRSRPINGKLSCLRGGRGGEGEGSRPCHPLRPERRLGHRARALSESWHGDRPADPSLVCAVVRRRLRSGGAAGRRLLLCAAHVRPGRGRDHQSLRYPPLRRGGPRAPRARRLAYWAQSEFLGRAHLLGRRGCRGGNRLCGDVQRLARRRGEGADGARAESVLWRLQRRCRRPPSRSS